MKTKVFYGLLSLFVAFGLWLYVIIAVSPESTETVRGIEVNLINEDALHNKGLMVTGSRGQTVKLQLEGNRSDLNKISLAMITVTADVSRLTTEGEDQAVYCRVTGIPDSVRRSRSTRS